MVGTHPRSANHNSLPGESKLLRGASLPFFIFMKTGKLKILIILGPTASGKSDLAVDLALKFNGEVVSADSRQVYKNLNIGTGKITKKEMRGVPHHLLDVANPRQKFTAADYTQLAHRAIENIIQKNKLPIICGGTGFYIDALLGAKQIPAAPPNLELRQKLEPESTEKLFAILQKLDPERAKNIDSKNPRRLVRAIEICKALGKVPKFESRSTNYEVCKIGIKIENEELKQRINLRLAKRLKKGMVREAKWLYQKGVSYKRLRELGLEYRRLADFLEGEISKKELTALLEKEIWQYAKRQMTWFKKDKKIVWIKPAEIKSAQKEVKKFLGN